MSCEGFHSDLNGHSRILITLGHYGFPIFCKVVTRSSTKAELVLGSFLGIKVDEPVTVHQDNTSAIKLTFLGKGSSGSNSQVFLD